MMDRRPSRWIFILLEIAFDKSWPHRRTQPRSHPVALRMEKDTLAQAFARSDHSAPDQMWNRFGGHRLGHHIEWAAEMDRTCYEARLSARKSTRIDWSETVRGSLPKTFSPSTYTHAHTHTYTRARTYTHVPDRPSYTSFQRPHRLTTFSLPTHAQSTSPARSPSSSLDVKLERRSSSSSRSTRVPRTGLTPTPLLPESRSESDDFPGEISCAPQRERRTKCTYDDYVVRLAGTP